MTDKTKKPSSEEFRAAYCMVPVQHPAAEMLQKAIEDAELASEMGLITPAYAHEVIRWARRSAANMTNQLHEAQHAKRARDAHHRRRRADRATVQHRLVWLVLMLLLAVLLMIVGAIGAVLWLS